MVAANGEPGRHGILAWRQPFRRCTKRRSLRAQLAFADGY
jgi:hypothetical protein